VVTDEEPAMLLKSISCDHGGVPLGATLGATGANDLLGFRKGMNNGKGRD
jgi:hypothetical protein